VQKLSTRILSGHIIFLFLNFNIHMLTRKWREILAYFLGREVKNTKKPLFFKMHTTILCFEGSGEGFSGRRKRNKIVILELWLGYKSFHERKWLVVLFPECETLNCTRQEDWRPRIVKDSRVELHSTQKFELLF